jgi:aminoglycoside phosphotransferase (APT) family kinase protein
VNFSLACGGDAIVQRRQGIPFPICPLDQGNRSGELSQREIIKSIAAGATIKELSFQSNYVYRLLRENGDSTIVKIYATPSRERRERHAMEALLGVEGVPQILERGATEGYSWIRMTDGGAWNLAALPRNLETIAKAGQILRGIHDSKAHITNLEGGIDGEYVVAHYKSTLDRLERYRRRLELPAAVLDAAKSSTNQPDSTAPVPSHTRPKPEKFVVAEDGSMTLIGWEWATLAPPEWDLSLATWRFSRTLGPDAAQALWDGYGARFSQERLKPWIAYHASMAMLDAAEQRDGRLGDLNYLITDLSSAIA